VIRVAAVVAAYDEAETIEPLARRLRAALMQLPDAASEIVLVIEGRDGTRQIVEDLAPELGSLRVLYKEDPAGLGEAFRRGFAAVDSSVDFVVTMDADLNHRPEEISMLLSALVESGADIVVGSRFVRGSHMAGMPVWKRVVSRCVNAFMTRLYRVKVHDKTSGFRIYRADVLRSLSFENSDFAFLPELLVRAARSGAEIIERPIQFEYRHAGRSKMALATTFRSYLRLFLSLSRPHVTEETAPRVER